MNQVGDLKGNSNGEVERPGEDLNSGMAPIY